VPAVDAGADVIIRALPVASPAPSPVLVALDGRSGVGKSTLASGVALPGRTGGPMG
jgi:2-phosphoglycerate kinase